MSNYLNILIPERLYKNNNNAPKEICNLQQSIERILKIKSNTIFDEMQKGFSGRSLLRKISTHTLRQ